MGPEGLSVGVAPVSSVGMRDLYAQILGVADPWHVTDVRLDVPAGKVEVIVEHRGNACCPK